MKPAIYTVFLMLAFSLLYATDSVAPQSDVSSDNNNSTYMPDLSMIHAIDENASLSLEQFLLMESNATAYDDNRSEETFTFEDITAKSWFYYLNFLSGMDTVHTYGTDVVIVVGSGIDYSLYWLLSDDGNRTEQPGSFQFAREDDNMTIFLAEAINHVDDECAVEPLLPQQLASRDRRKGEHTYLLSEWFDEETTNDGFLDKNNHSYIRLRGGYAFDYRGEDQYIYSITARLKIPRTREKVDLIIGDETKSSSDLSLQGTEEERDDSIALGLNNIFGLLDPVKTKIRLGISGIDDPYAKAAFKYEALLANWLMLPSQTFRYSRKEEFTEWTDLDFRRKLDKKIMLSLLFQRSSTNTVEGMNYFIQPSVNFALGKYGNLTPYAGIYGRTKEQPEDADGYRPKRGVYRYALGINWSKQSSRKYIVYRLQPIVSYDDQYEFTSNYYIKALLEFYFGLRD
ncbi:MAG: hypothetical protein WBF77_00555 [Sulfurimonadaceae bacterium]